MRKRDKKILSNKFLTTLIESPRPFSGTDKELNVDIRHGLFCVLTYTCPRQKLVPLNNQRSSCICKNKKQDPRNGTHLTRRCLSESISPLLRNCYIRKRTWAQQTFAGYCNPKKYRLFLKSL